MVQVYVSQLRKTLAAGGDGAEIVTRGRGYELRLGNGGLDSERFEHLITRECRARPSTCGAGRHSGTSPTSPSPSARSGAWKSSACGRSSWRSTTTWPSGRHREVIGEIEAVAAEEPLREHLHAQRMLALYRSGRQADALEAYSDYRHSLVEAIGAEPGPDLRRLHEAVLRQDPELALPGDAAPELPPELDAGTALVGRDDELAALREQWRDAHGGAGRLVVIAGERGIGKTRLAAELAAELHRDRATVLFARAPARRRRSPKCSRARAPRDGRRSWSSTTSIAPAIQSALRSTRSASELANLPVLVLAVGVAGIHADATVSLGPLAADAVAAIARRLRATHRLPPRAARSRPRAACRNGSTASRPSGRAREPARRTRVRARRPEGSRGRPGRPRRRAGGGARA